MFKKIIASLGALTLPVAVRAQNLGVGTLDAAATKYGGYQTTTIEDTIGAVIKTFLSLIGAIFLVLTVYAGYMWMIARGDEGKVEKAKDTLTRAVIGLIITLAAYAITYFITYYLSRGTLNTASGQG